MWPATAVTIHIDETSPANGFLRVVPGSHRWATPAPYENVNGAVVPEGSAPWGGRSDVAPPVPMPLGFDKVPGEVALYAERGDILFHDCYLWHSAALATDSQARRRHVRGSWYAGDEPANYGPADFVKNAAR
jgi:ectoine hydroxylase-related dioxygenase (phytanoyl-CoA dioxygenase family)